MTQEIGIYAAILSVAIPLIIGALKKIPFIPNEFAPFYAFVLGLIGGLLAFYTGLVDITPLGALALGIGTGGTSTGFYSISGMRKKKK